VRAILVRGRGEAERGYLGTKIEVIDVGLGE
jgi:hypothetical protein